MRALFVFCRPLLKDSLQAELDTQRSQLSQLRQALERIVNERDELRSEVGELKGTAFSAN